MYRYDVINHLIRKYGYTSYLEIGLSAGETFATIPCERKDSVDIRGNPTYKMTSDEFFDRHITIPYDIIFVDGDHSTEQAARDIENALRWIPPHGTVVAHDCNPTSRKMAADEDNGGCWMGGVWKTIARLRTDPLLTIQTVDTDCGVAVIRRGEQTPVELPLTLDYAYFDICRKSLLNIISVEAFLHDNG